MKLFLSPHNDDAVLFGAFTILREKPLVVTVFDSYLQPTRGNKGCDYVTRRKEDEAAFRILGCDFRFMGMRDDRPDWDGVARHLQVADMLNGGVCTVYAPTIEGGGHEHHNRIGEIADQVFGDRVVHYMTYTKAGKSTGVLVPYEPEWVLLKLKAMACYESQIKLPSCMPHFTRGLEEYYQP